MAHPAQKEYLLSVKDRFPERFTNCSVLDVGSLDINGNNHHLFTPPYTYIGVDIGPGPNVNVVSPIHLWDFPGVFDIVVSSECFEHDRHYLLSIAQCIEYTAPGGMFLFTCATTGRQEHGTLRSDLGYNSPHTHMKWNNYYKNLEESDVREATDLDLLFSEYAFKVHHGAKDLYFYGIKK